MSLASLAQEPLPDPTDLAEVRRQLAAADTEGCLRPIGMRAIEIGPQAIDALPALVRSLRRPGPIVVLGDPTRIVRGGDDLKACAVELLRPLGDVRYRVVGEGRPEVHADDAALAEGDAAIAGAGVVVVVGSGTMCDIGKDTTHRAGDVPLVIVQTAVSVNAFSDDMSVLVRDGVKRTTPTRWPDALLIDLGVIADAPADMNRAGFGELAAMFTAPADWYLAGALGMDDAWHPAPVGMFRREGAALLAAAHAVREREPEALALLARLMTLSGMALGVAGKTAPISGNEHIVSHLLDLDAEAAGRPLAFHGAQVGVASLVMSLAWDETLRTFDPSAVDVDACYPDPALVEASVLAAFGRLDPTGAAARECWHDVERKLARWRAVRPKFEAFLAEWPRHRSAMEALVIDPAELAAAVRRSGAPTRFSDLEPAVGADLARWALASCHLMRDRFVLADLRALTGSWNAAAIDRLLTRAGELGAGL